ncbi:MAG: DUF1186 family protein [Muribaculaceae bacterium]|nr:DUF1186 family protein [Muribaculaceae bacterium]
MERRPPLAVAAPGDGKEKKHPISMAKKKTKGKAAQQAPMSPKKYMQQKVRALPLGKCYITTGRDETGWTRAVVSRVRPNGNLVLGVFRLDTWCLGVREARYDVNMHPEDLADRVADEEWREATYDEIHALVYGVVDFARKGGVEPIPEFYTAAFILNPPAVRSRYDEEEDSDGPEFGVEGRHVMHADATREERLYIPVLRRRLGDEFAVQGEEPPTEVTAKTRKATGRRSRDVKREKMARRKVTYPSEILVTHAEVKDAVTDRHHFEGLTREMMAPLLKLPGRELAADASAILMYAIGKTRRGIERRTIGRLRDGIVLNSLLLITASARAEALDALLELLRQSEEFLDYHLNGGADVLLPCAVAETGSTRIDDIVAYIGEPEISPEIKAYAIRGLGMIAVRHASKREKVCEVFREFLLKGVPTVSDEESASILGYIIAAAADMGASQLRPEIRAAYAAGGVDLYRAGTVEEVEELLSIPRPRQNDDMLFEQLEDWMPK